MDHPPVADRAFAPFRLALGGTAWSGGAVVLLCVVLQGDWVVALVYELGCLGLLCWVEQLVQPASSPRLLGWLVGLMPGQFVDGVATLAALLTRRISWRGVVYAVRMRPSRVWILRDHWHSPRP